MRKTATVTVDHGRDQGKQYLLTEMPASRAEKWAARVFLGLARSGIEVPENIGSAGLAGIAAMGLRALGGLSFEVAEPLLDEMFGCVQRVTASGVARPLVEDDIEEVSTRLRLRREVFALHVDFSQAGALFNSAPASAQPADSPSP